MIDTFANMGNIIVALAQSPLFFYPFIIGVLFATAVLIGDWLS